MSEKNSVLRFGRAALFTFIFTGAALLLSYELNINFSTAAFAGEIDDDPLVVYDLLWNTLDGGAPEVLTSGTLTLFASVGQPDAGLIADHGVSTNTVIQTGFHFQEPDSKAWFVDGDDIIVPEGREVVRIPVSFHTLLPGTHTLGFTTVPNTATSHADYIFTSQQISFSDGETSGTLTIPIVNDGDNEPLETFSVTMSSPNSDINLKGNTTLNITIVDGPFIEVDRTKIEFPPHSISPGPSQEEVVTITNTGNAPLNFVGDKISISGDDWGEFYLELYGAGDVYIANEIPFPGYVFKSPDGSQINPGEEREVFLAFNPYEEGFKVSSLKLETNCDLNSEFSIPLSGLAYLDSSPIRGGAPGCDGILTGPFDVTDWEGDYFGHMAGYEALLRSSASRVGVQLDVDGPDMYQMNAWKATNYQQCDSKDQVIFTKWGVYSAGITIPENDEDPPVEDISLYDGTDIPIFRLRTGADEYLVNSHIRIDNSSPCTNPDFIAPVNSEKIYRTFHYSKPVNQNYNSWLDCMSFSPGVDRDNSPADDFNIEVGLTSLETRRYLKSDMDARFQPDPFILWDFDTDTFETRDIVWDDANEVWDITPQPIVGDWGTYCHDLYSNVSLPSSMLEISLVGDTQGDDELRFDFKDALHPGNAESGIFYNAAMADSQNIPYAQNFTSGKIYRIETSLSIKLMVDPNADPPDSVDTDKERDEAYTPSIRIRVVTSQTGDPVDNNFIYIHALGDNKQKNHLIPSLLPSVDVYTYSSYLIFPEEWNPGAIKFCIDAFAYDPAMNPQAKINIHKIEVFEQMDLPATASVALISPIANAVNQPIIPTFSFGLKDGALDDDDLLVDYYELTVSNNDQFLGTGETVGVPNTFYTLTIPNDPTDGSITVTPDNVLDYTMTYYWKIKAVDIVGNEKVSDVSSFSPVEPGEIPTLDSVKATPETAYNNVSWTPITNYGSPLKYEVAVAVGPFDNKVTETYTKLEYVDGGTYDHRNIESGIEYRYKVTPVLLDNDQEVVKSGESTLSNYIVAQEYHGLSILSFDIFSFDFGDEIGNTGGPDSEGWCSYEDDDTSLKITLPATPQSSEGNTVNCKVGVEFKYNKNTSECKDMDITFDAGLQTGITLTEIGPLNVSVSDFGITFDTTGDTMTYSGSLTMSANVTETTQVCSKPCVELLPCVGYVTYDFSDLEWSVSGFDSLGLNLLNNEGGSVIASVQASIDSAGAVSGDFAVNNLEFTSNGFAVALSALNFQYTYSIYEESFTVNSCNGSVLLKGGSIPAIGGDIQTNFAYPGGESPAALTISADSFTAFGLNVYDVSLNANIDLATFELPSLSVTLSIKKIVDNEVVFTLAGSNAVFNNGTLVSFTNVLTEIDYQGFHFTVTGLTYSAVDQSLTFASTFIYNGIAVDIEDFVVKNGEVQTLKAKIEIDASPILKVEAPVTTEYPYGAPNAIFEKGTDGSFRFFVSASISVMSDLATVDATLGLGSIEHNGEWYTYGVIKASVAAGTGGVPLGATGLNLTELGAGVGHYCQPADNWAFDPSVMLYVSFKVGIADTAGMAEFVGETEFVLGDQTSVTLSTELSVPATSPIVTGSVSATYVFGSESVSGDAGLAVSFPSDTGKIFSLAADETGNHDYIFWQVGKGASTYIWQARVPGTEPVFNIFDGLVKGNVWFAFYGTDTTVSGFSGSATADFTSDKKINIANVTIPNNFTPFVYTDTFNEVGHYCTLAKLNSDSTRCTNDYGEYGGVCEWCAMNSVGASNGGFYGNLELTIDPANSSASFNIINGVLTSCTGSLKVTLSGGTVVKIPDWVPSISCGDDGQGCVESMIINNVSGGSLALAYNDTTGILNLNGSVTISATVGNETYTYNDSFNQDLSI